MRHLTTQGIFHEPALGVFANTVQSRTMAGNPEFCAHLDIVYVVLVSLSIALTKRTRQHARGKRRCAILASVSQRSV